MNIAFLVIGSEGFIIWASFTLKGQSDEKVCEIMTWDVLAKTKVRQQFLKF
jgi:hypothetical protein